MNWRAMTYCMSHELHTYSAATQPLNVGAVHLSCVTRMSIGLWHIVWVTNYTHIALQLSLWMLVRFTWVVSHVWVLCYDILYESRTIYIFRGLWRFLCDMSHSWLMRVSDYICRQLSVTNYIHMLRAAAHLCDMSRLRLMRVFNCICRQLSVTNYIHMLRVAAHRCDMSPSWLTWVLKYICRQLWVTNYIHMLRVAGLCDMSRLWLMYVSNYIGPQLSVTN